MDAAGMDEIAAFLAVAEARSFTTAARSLGRDASVLSRRVGALEARLGVRLLERTTRRVTPTEAGTRLRERMRDALAAMEEAEAEAAQAGASAKGVLRLALPAAFGRMWVAPLLPAFLAAHPDVAIEADYADRYVDLIAEGFDVAVRLGELRDGRLVARRLALARRLVCAAPAYLEARGRPGHPEDLRRHACLGFTGQASHPVWRLCRGDGVVAVRAAGPLLANDAQSLVAAALAGAGVMICADWLVAPELAQGRLVPLLDDWTVEGGSAVSLVRPSAQFTPGKTRAFVDWIAGRLAQAPWSR